MLLFFDDRYCSLCVASCVLVVVYFVLSVVVSCDSLCVGVVCSLLFYCVFRVLLSFGIVVCCCLLFGVVGVVVFGVVGVCLVVVCCSCVCMFFVVV